MKPRNQCVKKHIRLKNAHEHSTSKNKEKLPEKNKKLHIMAFVKQRI